MQEEQHSTAEQDEQQIPSVRAEAPETDAGRMMEVSRAQQLRDEEIKNVHHLHVDDEHNCVAEREPGL